MAVETSFRIIHNDPDVRRILSPPTVCKQIASNSAAEMSHVQLIGGTHLDHVLPELVRRIAMCLVENPPHRYKWFSRITLDKSILVRFMVDKAEPSLCHMCLTSEERADLMAFRGLLAKGILVHCLQKRFRVEFGLKTDTDNQGGNVMKRMAVPYRASDTPSQKSEFKQPDCAITLTYISYYYGGLTPEQVRACCM